MDPATDGQVTTQVEELHLPRRALMVLTLMGADAVCISVSLLVAAAARDGLALVLRGASGHGPLEPLGNSLPVFNWVSAILLIFVAIYASRGLYPGHGLGPVEELRRLSLSTTLAIFSLVVISFLAKTSATFSRVHFVLAWGFLLVLVPLGRFLTRRLLSYWGLWGEPVAVLGDPHLVEAMVDRLKNQPRVGYLPLLTFPVRSSPRSTLMDRLRDAAEDERIRVRQLGVTTALVSVSNVNGDARAITRSLEPYFRHISLVLPEGELPLDLVQVHRIDTLPALKVRNALSDPWSLLQKRVMDLLLAGILTIICLPFLAVVALAIKLDSRGPVFFVQRRLGKGGEMFSLLKFRTMYRDSEERLAQLLSARPELRREWGQFQKLANDPRVTRTGRVLRALSLDELPQLWNVLKGEMSLVGPRPFFADQRILYGDDAYESYLRVPPGVTGAWQTNGRNHASFSQRAKMDVAYVRDWSVWLDLYILAKTPWVVISRRGAY